MDKRIIIPKYAPKNPPKNYSKKKAIGVFVCLYFSFGPRCPEVLRARITTGGEIYVMPFVEYHPFSENSLKDFHMSYHVSGEFHWTKDGTHTKPLYGEADLRKAFESWLKFRFPMCICFRKGKELREEEIDNLIECLSSYLPITVNIKEAAQNMKHKRFHRLVSPFVKQVKDSEVEESY